VAAPRPGRQRRAGPGPEPRRPPQRAPLRGVRGRWWTTWRGRACSTGPTSRCRPARSCLASSHRDRGLPRPAAVRAPRLLQDVGLPAAAGDRLPGRPPRAGPFLDGYFPRLLRERFAEALPGPRAAAGDRGDRGRSTTSSTGAAIALLPRLEQGARNGIGEAVTAWIEVDRRGRGAGPARGGARLRPSRGRGAGGAPRDRGRARGRAQERLEGKKGAGARKASRRSGSGSSSRRWRCDPLPLRLRPARPGLPL